MQAEKVMILHAETDFNTHTSVILTLTSVRVNMTLTSVISTRNLYTQSVISTRTRLISTRRV
jgi:hypothetical protein